MVTQTDYVARLRGDVLRASDMLSVREVRYLVDHYYIFQEYRKAADNQMRALSKSEEPHSVIAWLSDSTLTIESQLKRVMQRYSQSKRPGRWLLSIYGIGPVLSAGLLAHIDITRAPTAGHIWRFAGLDPTQCWLGEKKAHALIASLKEQIADPEQSASEIARAVGSKVESVLTRARNLCDQRGGKEVSWDDMQKVASLRPWNSTLRTLAWKIGQSFLKFHNHPQCFYGHIYAARKALEVDRNGSGAFRAMAQQTITERKIADRKTRQTYEQGKLPDGRLELRAERYAVKIFLAHLHDVMYEDFFKTLPPKPYVIEHLGHGHNIEIPGWPCD